MGKPHRNASGWPWFSHAFFRVGALSQSAVASDTLDFQEASTALKWRTWTSLHYMEVYGRENEENEHPLFLGGFMEGKK